MSVVTNEIVNGRRSVTPDTALRLGRFTDTEPESWLNLQQAVDDVWDALHSGEQDVHQKSRQPSVPIGKRVDVAEHPGSRHGPNGGLILLLDEVEQRRHRVTDDLPVRRHMPGILPVPPDAELGGTACRKIRRSQPPRRPMP